MIEKIIDQDQLVTENQALTAALQSDYSARASRVECKPTEWPAP